MTFIPTNVFLFVSMMPSEFPIFFLDALYNDLLAAPAFEASEFYFIMLLIALDSSSLLASEMLLIDSSSFFSVADITIEYII